MAPHTPLSLCPPVLGPPGSSYTHPETKRSELCSHNRYAKPSLNLEMNLLKGTRFPSWGRLLLPALYSGSGRSWLGTSLLCVPQAQPMNSSCPGLVCIFQGYSSTGLVQRFLFTLQIYAVLGLFWTLNWVLALGQCVLAGAFASFYWAFHKPRDVPTFPLSAAFIRTLR